MQYNRLSNLHIGQAVEELSAYLEGTTLGKADGIRTVFAVEEALLHYQSRFGEETPFTLVYGKKWGREQFALCVRGVAFDPFSVEEDEEFPSITQNLMSQMGLFPQWKYTSGGGNTISMVLPKIPSSPLKKMALAVLLAVVIYVLSIVIPGDWSQILYEHIITPLSVIASPLVAGCSLKFLTYSWIWFQ